MSSDVPSERPLPSLRTEGVAEQLPGATVVGQPSLDTLASLKEEGKTGATMTLDADDILTDARARTELLGIDDIPPTELAYERAETAILLAPEPPPPAPRELPPRMSAPSIVSATEIAVERPRSRRTDNTNLVLLVVGGVLFVIAAAIVIGALSH